MNTNVLVFCTLLRLVLQGKNKMPIKAKRNISRNDIKYQIQHVNLQYKKQAMPCPFMFNIYITTRRKFKYKTPGLFIYLFFLKVFVFFAGKQSSGKFPQHH